jgi:VWFA-related protein
MALLGIAGAVHAQQEPPPVFHSTVVQSFLHVVALDRHGRSVTDLAAADIDLTSAEGEPVPIDLFVRPNEASLDLALLVDRSLSMSLKPEEAARRLEEFLDDLSPNDCVYLLPFGHTVGPGRWSHPGGPGFREWLQHLPVGGDTALFDALLHAQAKMLDPTRPSGDSQGVSSLFPFSPLYEALAKSTAHNTRAEGCPRAAGARRARRVIAVVTDGRDTASKATLMDVLLGGALANIPILVVGFVPVTNAELYDLGRQRETRRQPAFEQRRRWRRSATVRELEAMLDQISAASGGALLLARPEEAYATILSGLRGYYVLGYRLPAAADSIQATASRTGVYLLAQPGYFAPGLEMEPAATLEAIDGFERLDSGDVPGALAHFESALRSGNESAVAYLGRSEARRRLGDLDGAEADRAEALTLAPWLLGTVPHVGPEGERAYIALEQPRATFIDDRIVADALLVAAGRYLAAAERFGLTLDFGLASYSLQIRTAPADSAASVEVSLELFAPDGSRAGARSFRTERDAEAGELADMVAEQMGQLLESLPGR